MNKPVKLPEIRKEAFTKARESLGLSTKDLSGKACLSVRQIEQIENGESSSFYGAQVKVTAAKKVAGLLKLSEEEAFDFSHAESFTKEAASQEKLQEVAKSPEKGKKFHTDNVAVEKVAPKTAIEDARVSENTVLSAANGGGQRGNKEQPANNSQKKIFFLLAIGAAVIFSLVNLRPLFFPEPVKQEVVIIQEPPPEPVPANTPAEPVVETKAAVAPVAVIESAQAAISTECPTADASPINYKPEAPKKAGDMVYLQAKTAQTICVVDGAGKTQSKTLEPGVGVSVFGKPPLKVLTGGLNQVDMYYQGAKVRLGNTTNKTVILEQAEIIQPVVAPLTSADSQAR
ncbi:RodZ family helix-turn-helix domain-containing protein [Polynucleobacter sp. MWH-Braz-FAM2G]|uniref:helix-turn-helix domain-containing protein n=1 Tax=Polynucleobacter sp. MWH-Braz-FAM2G TaxID=1855883 RepID=UPI001BFEE962|nr:helix-turn-helix domain-containing protein [Polynucleobacter sp. MWH-Braz-FAM2G]QWD90097.1 helix-turn-helix domain-containing protein [Polynucleobacter sp. MWH-Braz-FAM2G]